MDESVSYNDLLRLVLAGKGDAREKLSERKFRARANIVACVQSIHSVSDILSHAIYYVLGLKQAKGEREINISRVARWVQPASNHGGLVKLLDELIAHEGYIYLNALANHSKHRSIVSLGINFNFKKSGNERKELVFPRFSYEGTDYTERKVYEFLEAEFDRQSKLIIDIGNELNVLSREMR